MQDVICYEQRGGQAIEWLVPFLRKGARLLVRPDPTCGDLWRLWLEDHSELLLDLLGLELKPRIVSGPSDPAFPKDAKVSVICHYASDDIVGTRQEIAGLPGKVVQTGHGLVGGYIGTPHRQDPDLYKGFDLLLVDSLHCFEGRPDVRDSVAHRLVGNIPLATVGRAVLEKGYLPRGFRSSSRKTVLVCPSHPRSSSLAGIVVPLAKSGLRVVYRPHGVSKMEHLFGKQSLQEVVDSVDSIGDHEIASIDWRMSSVLRWLNAADVLVTDHSSTAFAFAAIGKPVACVTSRSHPGSLPRFARTAYVPKASGFGRLSGIDPWEDTVRTVHQALELGNPGDWRLCAEGYDLGLHDPSWEESLVEIVCPAIV